MTQSVFHYNFGLNCCWFSIGFRLVSSCQRASHSVGLPTISRARKLWITLHARNRTRFVRNQRTATLVTLYAEISHRSRSLFAFVVFSLGKRLGWQFTSSPCHRNERAITFFFFCRKSASPRSSSRISPRERRNLAFYVNVTRVVPRARRRFSSTPYCQPWETKSQILEFSLPDASVKLFRLFPAELSPFLHAF